MLQTKAYGNNQITTALVIRTGFATLKGSLIRSILFPSKSRLRLYSEVFQFQVVLALLGLIGFFFSLKKYLMEKWPLFIIIVSAFDLITTTVPPALQATLTIGTSFALNRLKNANLFCIEPMRINTAGKVGVMFFDKTGTLTEDSL